MAEYTIKDVIIDPEDSRAEVGKRYYFSLGAQDCVDRANRDSRATELLAIDKSGGYHPFISDGEKDYPFIIRKKEPSYAERQAKWIADNDIKRGDKVRIVRAADSKEDGWRNRWNPDMDEAVGRVGTVSHISANLAELGIGVDAPGVGEFMYPYFVLEKAEEEHAPYDFEDQDCRALLVGKVVRYKSGDAGGPVMITGFERLESRGWIAHLGGGNVTDAEELLNHCEFIDGTPCGVAVEDEEECP